MSPLDTHLERLLRRIRETSDAFEAQLAALPSSKPCDRHRGQTAVLLVHKSWDARQPVYGCPACADEVRHRRRQRRFAAAGIPRDVHHATLDNFELDRPLIPRPPPPPPRPGEEEEIVSIQTPPQFLEAARKFEDGEARNLILTGLPGIGKGHLAAALAIAALDRGEDIAWIDCASLFAAYHRAYATGTTHRIIQQYSSPPLLVLDELCLRELPADGEEILFAIIDRRHKAAHRTILLGNQTAQGTRTWLGSRLYDRLKSGGCLYRYGEWESLRGHDGDGAETF